MVRFWRHFECAANRVAVMWGVSACPWKDGVSCAEMARCQAWSTGKVEWMKK